MTKQKTKTTVGERIRTLRDHYRNKGLTAKVLSDYLGISTMQLNNMENDKVKYPNHEVLKSLADVLGSSIAWIENGTGEMLLKGEADISKVFVEKSGSPWKDEAYIEIKHQRDFFEKSNMQLQNALIKMIDVLDVKLGKLTSLNSTGLRVIKKRRLLRDVA